MYALNKYILYCITLQLILFYNVTQLVSGGALTTGLCCGGGFLISRFCKSVGYYVNLPLLSVPYSFHKYCSFRRKYIHASTMQDIVYDKYLYIDMFSSKHNRYITVTDEDDNHYEGMYNVKRYEIVNETDSDIAKTLTIGKVFWFHQELDDSLNHENRVVYMFNDDFNRLCIRIVSYDRNGNDIRSIVYRKKRRWWYMRHLTAKEASPITNIFNRMPNFNFPVLHSPAETINLITSKLPQWINTHMSIDHIFYFPTTLNGCAGRIKEIIFQAVPVKPSDGMENIYIWRFASMQESPDTKYVVLYETGNGLNKLRLFKNSTTEVLQYNEVDYFVTENDLLKCTNTSATHFDVQTKELNFHYDINKNNGKQLFEDGLFVIAYPESGHYVVRPVLNDTAIVKLLCLVIHDPNGIVNLSFPTENYWSFLAFEDIPEENQQMVGIATFNRFGSDYGSEDAFFAKSESRLNYNLEIHTVSLLTGFHSPYYYAFSTTKPYLSSHSFVSMTLDDRVEDFALTANYNGHIFMAHNLLHSQNKVINKFHIDKNGPALKLMLDLNTQLLYCKHDGMELVIVMQNKSGLSIYNNKGDMFHHITDTSGILSNLGLEHLGNLKKAGFETKSVELILSDKPQNHTIEVLLISSNTTLFYTDIGTRIGKVCYMNHCITIESGIVQVTYSIQAQLKLVLVDVITNGDVLRQLYYLEDNDELPFRLMSTSRVKCELDELNNFRKSLKDSIFDITPRLLPIVARYTDSLVHVAQFPDSKLAMLFEPYNSLLTPGDYNTTAFNYTIPTTQFFFRQIIKRGESPPIHAVFTLTRDGMHMQGSIYEDNFDEVIPLETKEIPSLLSNARICLADVNFDQEGVFVYFTKLGNMDVTTFKPINSAYVLNPIAFGAHEIQFDSNLFPFQVVVSRNTETNIKEITVSVSREGTTGGKTSYIRFIQKSPGGVLYTFSNDNEELNFVDLNHLLNSPLNYTVKNDILDLNNFHVPHHIRFVRLKDDFVYYAGNITSHDGMKVIFGKQEFVELTCMGCTFNIWVRYPDEKNRTADVFIHCCNAAKCLNRHYTLDDFTEAAMLKYPPEPKYFDDPIHNWGPLSAFEFGIVNANLVRLALHTEEMSLVNINIKASNLHHSVLKMKIDDSTLLFTTAAHSCAVINDVHFMRMVIKGIPKTLVKLVFYSKGDDDSEIILIISQTISGIVSNAWSVGDDFMQPISVKSINYKMHRGIARFIK